MKNSETNEKPEDFGGISGKNPEALTRDEILRLSSQTIRALHKRVSGKRFREQQSDAAKLSHLRVLVQLLQAYGSLLRDNDITELQRQIDALKSQVGGKP